MIPFSPELFQRLCRECVTQRRAEGEGGIGTLAEKRLHAVVKKYICPNEDFHEVGIQNTRFVADVMLGDYMFEVQTGSFAPMQKKIAYCLEHTDATITVVHPIPAIRWMHWIDPDTYDISPKKRVTKKGRVEDLLPQLYFLLPHLQNPRLRFAVMLMEVEDFRFLSKRRNPKKGAQHYERIPVSLLEIVEFSSPADFARFLPDTLPEHFTVKEFSRLTKIRGRDAYSAVRVLAALGLLEEAQPIGRSMGWRIAERK